jgi:glutaredoxin
MPEVIVYSTPACPRCKLLIAELRRVGLPCREMPLDGDALSRCLIEADRWVTEAPLIEFDQRWYFAADVFDKDGNLRLGWDEQFR